MKALGFLGLLIITAHETYVCVKRFMDVPKYTSNKLSDQINAEFPSLTFCSQVNMGYKSHVLEVSFIILQMAFYHLNSAIKQSIPKGILKYFCFVSGKWNRNARIF